MEVGGGGGEGCCNFYIKFYIKTNLKYEIFNDKKKFINKNVFLSHSEEFKLKKKIVTFKR